MASPRGTPATAESPAALRQRVQREQQLRARLRRAAGHLEVALTERRWAIVAAHQQGLSLRQIADATDLGPTRIHQLLRAADPDALPMRLRQIQAHEWPEPAVGSAAARQEGAGALAAPLAEEAALLWDCLGWLERLEREACVAVNLRPADDPHAEYVPFDRSRVFRVLRRIASHLDELARDSPAGEPAAAGDAVDAATRHRQRLAEPPAVRPRLTAREERAALRAAAGLDPLP